MARQQKIARFWQPVSAVSFITVNVHDLLESFTFRIFLRLFNLWTGRNFALQHFRYHEFYKCSRSYAPKNRCIIFCPLYTCTGARMSFLYGPSVHYTIMYLFFILIFFMHLIFLYFGLQNIFGWFVKDFLVMNPTIYDFYISSIHTSYRYRLLAKLKKIMHVRPPLRNWSLCRFHLKNWWIKKLPTFRLRVENFFMT